MRCMRYLNFTWLKKPGGTEFGRIRLRACNITFIFLKSFWCTIITDKCNCLQHVWSNWRLDHCIPFVYQVNSEFLQPLHKFLKALQQQEQNVLGPVSCHFPRKELTWLPWQRQQLQEVSAACRCLETFPGQAEMCPVVQEWGKWAIERHRVCQEWKFSE